MASFESTLEVIGIDEADVLQITTVAKITSFTRLRVMTASDVFEEVKEANLPKTVGSLMVAVRMLYSVWQKIPVKHREEWETFFNETMWDEFMCDYEPERKVGSYLRNRDDVSINIDKLRDDDDDDKESKGFRFRDDDELTVGSKALSVSKSTSVSSSWKVDSRDIPKLPKNKSVQAGFSIWEQSFKVKMQLAKVGDIMEDEYDISTLDDDELQVYKEKDAYLKSCLVTATMETTAYCEVTLSKSGRDIWFDLLKSYHGEDYVKGEATAAAMELANMRYDKKSGMTGDKFVSEYKQCLTKMAEFNTPFPLPLIKADFLSKVTHPGLRNWKLLMQESGDTVGHGEMFTKVSQTDRGPGRYYERRQRQSSPSQSARTEGTSSTYRG